MQAKEQIVMYESAEAASIKTVTGWVSRTGRFWGDDEHMARFDGCTHMKCKTCGQVMEVRNYCRPCADKKKIEKYEAMQRVEWNSTDFLYSITLDKYADDIESFEDDLDEGETLADLMIVICKPNYATQVETDYWSDDLPEDGDVPPELEDALDALNAVIRKLPPLSWSPGKVALDVGSIAKATGEA